jgi:hypothetical protein
MTMAKNKVVFVIFVLSLVLAAPSILKILKGDFKASQLFSDNPFQNLIKSVVLRNYPESKVVEERLEQLIPESSVNVSISTLYAQGGKSTNLNISVISDTLGTKTSKYSNIKMSVSDLKFNSTNTFSTDIKCT